MKILFVFLFVVGGVMARAHEKKDAFGTESIDWGQAQSFIADWNGKPVFSANWEGRYRPFEWDGGKLKAILSANAGSIRDIDLMTPTPMSPKEILFEGRAPFKGDDFDIYYFNSESSVIRRLTEPGLDRGDLCADKDSRFLSWREGKIQRFARLTNDGKLETIKDQAEGFVHCQWVDGKTMLGIERTRPTDFRLYRCAVEAARSGGDWAIRCEGTGALDSFDDVTGFFVTAGQVKLVARKTTDEFRRPYAISIQDMKLSPLPWPESQKLDVLGIEGNHARVSSNGRYGEISKGSSGPISFSKETISFLKAVGPDLFAIYADPDTPRTLARKKGNRWIPYFLKGQARPSGHLEPREIWIPVTKNMSVQAFVFGGEGLKRAVIWWHGGPHESVSPRYNPYYDWLNHLGYAVFAVNYPGSSTRGQTFEKQFSKEIVKGTTEAVVSYLRQKGLNVIVSWSVSTGSLVQDALLAGTSRVSLLIDQAGSPNPSRRRIASQKGIPYFGIHGDHDPIYPGLPGNEFVYKGGHDLTDWDEFKRLEVKLGPVLSHLH